MIHVLASFGFALVAVATLSLIVLMIAASSEAIASALGIDRSVSTQPLRRQVRIRTAGRWQTRQTVKKQAQRAAA